MDQTKKSQRYGSPVGLALTIAVGFALYFLLLNVPSLGFLPTYTEIISAIDFPSAQFLWFLINFTEPEFYAGVITTIFLLIGACTAWLLSVRKSKYAGIEICYGSARMWPWVLASQVLSLLLTEYLFGYLNLFALGKTWIPTFIVIVSVPPSMVLMYGPGIKTLLTASVLGAALCTPTAYLISVWTTELGIPGATNNVLAMAITGIISGAVCRVLPWMEKADAVPTDNINAPEIDYGSAFWVLRRTVADLTEPQFYGSDLAGTFLIVGVCIEWVLGGKELLSGAAGFLPAIILSQFISGSLGVFLYTEKYREKGWYATYVPVVCTAPACILLHGATMPIILVSSILGGIIGAPIAEWVDDHKPAYIHGTVSNVTAMALSTVIVSAVIGCISWL